jgi:hypothetical protein
MFKRVIFQLSPTSYIINLQKLGDYVKLDNNKILQKLIADKLAPFIITQEQLTSLKITGVEKGFLTGWEKKPAEVNTAPQPQSPLKLDDNMVEKYLRSSRLVQQRPKVAS